MLIICLADDSHEISSLIFLIFLFFFFFFFLFWICSVIPADPYLEYFIFFENVRKIFQISSVETCLLLIPA